jgi:hypothetical protein
MKLKRRGISQKKTKNITCLHHFLAAKGTTGKGRGKLDTDNLSARREIGHRQLVGQEGSWSQTTYWPRGKLVTENLSARRETGHRQLIGRDGNWSQTTYRPVGL